MSPTQPVPAPLARIEGRILVIRGLKVMVDADLAELYGVSTKALTRRSSVMRGGSRKISCSS